jgi:hypothetical protein
MYLLQYSDTSIIPKSNTKRPISSWIFGEVLPKSLKVWVRCDNFKALHIKMHVHTSNLNTGSHWFTLNKFSAPCYCMYSFNIVRHHIIPKFNTKRPIASWPFFCEVLPKSLKFWVVCDNFKALHIEMHVHTSNLNTSSPWPLSETFYLIFGDLT